MYASFLRIRAPCISSFLNSLPKMLFFNGLLENAEEPEGSGMCAVDETVHEGVLRIGGIRGASSENTG